MTRGGISAVARVILLPWTLVGQEQGADAGRVVDGQLVSDTFEIRHQWEGDTLLISVRSDLPDAAALMVSVDRFYWESGSPDTYSIPYLSEKTRIGAWEDRTHRVVIGDEAWQDSLQAKQRLMASAGMPFEVRRIGDSVRVDFTVPINQDDPRFGQGNENLTGAAVSEEGLRVVEKEIAFHKPLGEAPTAPQWVSRNNLTPGSTYTISEPAPLMPSFEPQDPVAAAAAAVEMPAGTRITVEEVRTKQGNPWYRISAVSATGDTLGSGWLNSTALIGQAIRKTGG